MKRDWHIIRNLLIGEISLMSDHPVHRYHVKLLIDRGWVKQTVIKAGSDTLRSARITADGQDAADRLRNLPALESALALIEAANAGPYESLLWYVMAEQANGKLPTTGTHRT